MTSRIDANGVVMWPWFGVTNAPYKSLGTDPYYENWRGANPADQARAVLNGSVIEMLKCVDQLKQLGTPVESIRFSGGGANSDLLANIIASYTGLPVEVPEDIEASSVGAGISAMVATNEFGSVEEACDATIKFRDPIKPNLQDQDALRALAQKYDDDFQRLYPEAWKRHHEAKKI
ncbi:MAG: FGGY-family carbohydrate kinase [Candidatus Margulisiibacteriota bacterium]